MEIEREDFYFVDSGETLQTICDKMKVSIFEVKKLNYLTSDKIEKGDFLVLPPSYKEIYMVKPLDTLCLIAKSKGISEERIKQLNNIGNEVFIGERLYL